MLRLITIPISHYCEKARWALERAGIPYREERHVQGVHQFFARRAGGKLTVPVLVTPAGAIGESAEILDWVDRRTPAALSASVVVPPVYGARLPQPDVLSPEMAALVERAREHPAGRYALELFAEHRRATVEKEKGAASLPRLL